MHIATHPFDRNIIEQNMRVNDANLDSYTRDIASGNYGLVQAVERITRENVLYAAALKQSAGEQFARMDRCIEASIAHHQMAVHVGTTVEIEIAGQKHQVTPPDKDYVISEHSWMSGFMAALAARRMALVHAFCDMDLDLIHSKKTSLEGPHVYLAAKFFHGMFRPKAPHGERLLAAANQIMAPGEKNELTRDHALHIIGPLLDLSTALVTQDAADFNENLVSALELHKKYWSQKSANLPEGLVSLPITALVVTATDYDMTIEHTSDYLIAPFIAGRNARA